MRRPKQQKPIPLFDAPLPAPGPPSPAPVATPPSAPAPAPPVAASPAVAAETPVAASVVPAAANGHEPMSSMALVFLNDPIARQLAVAWVTCKGNEREWLAAAGVSVAQEPAARRLMASLKANRICRDGGVTDEMALQFIRASIAKTLGGGKTK